jgi:hypothetical protein
MAKESKFRVSVYWEKYGGAEEGSMYDERQLDVNRKPTGHEMGEIAKAIQKKLEELGLVEE